MRAGFLRAIRVVGWAALASVHAACGWIGFEDLSNVGDDFDPPVVVTDLSSASLDSGATFSQDGLMAVVASTRSGGAGGFDLWMASRSDRGAPFDLPAPMTIANSAGTDADPILSADDRELFYSSARDEGRMLWRVVRECR